MMDVVTSKLFLLDPKDCLCDAYTILVYYMLAQEPCVTMSHVSTRQVRANLNKVHWLRPVPKSPFVVFSLTHQYVVT